MILCSVSAILVPTQHRRYIYENNGRVFIYFEDFFIGLKRRSTASLAWAFSDLSHGESKQKTAMWICYEGTAPTLLVLDQLQSELKTLFGCSVDMVRLRDSMNQCLKEQIKKEAIYV